MLEIDHLTLSIGQIVGERYRLTSIIGEGGMGTIWEATDTQSSTNEPRALKFIRRDRVEDARSEARLLREARALATIAHDNVARIFEVSELPAGTPFLVMERLVGETLKQRLTRLERLAYVDTLRIARAVADGVAAAHAVGIVHRDLKPDNVFILEDGRVKVLDFGIAKELPRPGDEEEKAESSLTTTGAMLGTLHYMAPEQVFGDTDIDERADVWALGIVMYECLSGKKPTDGSGSGQVLKAIMTGQFSRLDEMDPSCPRETADLVLEMLSRDRALRPSMKDVCDRLMASSASRASSPARSPRPSRALATTSSTAALSLDNKGEGTPRVDGGGGGRRRFRTPALMMGGIIGLAGIVTGAAFRFGVRDRHPTDETNVATTAATTAPTAAATAPGLPTADQDPGSAPTASVSASPSTSAHVLPPPARSQPLPSSITNTTRTSASKPNALPSSSSTSASVPSSPSVGSGSSSSTPPFSTSRR